MTVQITIIGLGQIGTSIGLALSERKDVVKIVGHDFDPGAAQKAQKLGAVDQVHFNLPASVANADLVILALPLDAIRDTLKIIGQDLREDAVVMDTAPVKAPVVQWVKEFLPAKRHYIGLLPVINATYLVESKFGQDAAHADLFKKGLMGIMSVPGTPGEAIKLASDLALLLGASSLFIDLEESDSLMASVHILPQLAASGLLAATYDQPGWREGRKLAGRAYAFGTGPLTYQDSLPALLESISGNKANTLRVLNEMIEQFMTIRDDIANDDDESLKNRLEKVYDGRVKWWSEREKGDWAAEEISKAEMPKMGDVFKRMFTGERKKK